MKTLSSNSKRAVIGVVFFLVLVISLTSLLNNTVGKTTQKSPESQPEVVVAQQPQISKEEAQKELESLMKLSKESGLVMSYDFSELGTEIYQNDVYIGKGWYSQTVQFKKDFMARIGILKEVLTGYSNVEFRDGYSNEKVAEISGFKGIQVYK